MQTMKLIRTPAGWHVQTSDPKVRDLFGTDTIPTAYTAVAPAEVVLAAIQNLNPHAVVTLA